MRELQEQIVARLDEVEDLLEAALGHERPEALTRLRVVGHRNARPEEAREHLAPRAVRFGCLIGHRRIAGQEHGGGVRRRRNLDGGDGGLAVAELQRQRVVPVGGANLARLQRHGFRRRRAGRVRVFTTNVRVTTSPRAVATRSSMRRRDSDLTVVSDSPPASPSVTVTR